MKVSHSKIDGGKTLRTTSLNMADVIEEKLSNKKMLDTHEAQIDVYKLKTGEVIDRKFMFYNEAVEFGTQIKAEFKDLGYRIIQVVE